MSALREGNSNQQGKYRKLKKTMLMLNIVEFYAYICVNTLKSEKMHKCLSPLIWIGLLLQLSNLECTLPLLSQIANKIQFDILFL